MLKILFTMHPLIGHYHAMVPLALALKAQGHSVLFATGATFAPLVEAAGFEHVPCGLDAMGSVNSTDLPDWPAIMTQTEPGGIRQLWGFILGYAPSMADDVITLVREWKPDVLIRDPSEYGGYIAAEVCDIPYASIHWAIYISVHGCERPLTELRRRYGLPDASNLQGFDRYFTLNAMPPSWTIMGIVPPVMHRFCMPPFDLSVNQNLPEWIHTLPGQQTVYVTLGTAFNQKPGQFRVLISALGTEKFNTIITVGSSLDPNQFYPLPPQVRIEQYIPQSLILPYCDAMIFHGGYNSMLSALWHGLPVVITPQEGGDQAPTARQCTELGFGIMVNGTPPEPGAIRDAIRAVLTQSSYRQRARSLQREINTMPPLADAIHRLEILAHTRKPQLNKTKAD